MSDQIEAKCACGAEFFYSSTHQYAYLNIRARFQEWIAVHNKCPYPRPERFKIDQSKRRR